MYVSNVCIHKTCVIAKMTVPHYVKTAERMRLCTQASEMTSLCWVAGLRQGEKTIQDRLRLESLLLQMEKSQLRWHLAFLKEVTEERGGLSLSA